MSFEFATIDFETTGFSPTRNRIIEIGVVRSDSSGKLIDEYQTLIQPKQDVGRTDIHGITPTHLKNAPTFDQITQDLARILNGAILVAHNAKFDFSFLEHELERANQSFADVDGLCTLELVYQVIPSGSRKLVQCCEHFGIPVGQAHTAIEDARMTSKLCAKLFEICDLTWLPDPFQMSMPHVESSKPVTRASVAAPIKPKKSPLAKIAAKSPGKPAKGQISAVPVSQYLNLLDEALNDEVLDQTEVKALGELAEQLGLSGSQISLLNSSYIHNLCGSAAQDGVITPEERTHIGKIADQLGVTEWQQLLDSRKIVSTTSDQDEGQQIKGLSVCFTGTMSRPREVCQENAQAAGLVVKEGVTKSLDILVVADINTESSKARKARQFSIRIISESAFFDLIKS